MHIIENNILRVSIHEKGAELTSIYHKPLDLEYLWEGDPAFWAKQSPVLFPIVGGLKNNTYFYHNTAYELPRHGFAREKVFSVTDHTSSQVTFSLFPDEETRQVYPFEFEFKISYSLEENTLSVKYQVQNIGREEMYFSVGGHPAFKVPLVENTKYEDYYLEFNKAETSPRWAVSHDGLIEEEPIPVFHNDSVIRLQKELFMHDALVFKDLVSNKVSLKCAKHNRAIDFDFSGFPYLGIWAAKNADFVCIEPWRGIADGVNTDQQLKHKEGINKLVSKEEFTVEWRVTVR